MKKKYMFMSILLSFILAIGFMIPVQASSDDYSSHGRLHISGNQLVDKNGNAVVLKGASTHGLSWYPKYVNYNSFKTLKSWGANTIRLAMYTSEYHGYCSGGSQKKLKALVCKGVSYAKKLGMYVIIDWHILSDGNPNTHKKAARSFFKYMSSKYKNDGHVLYEICNEPNGNVSWAQVKSYAKYVIPTIRKKSPQSIIICGSPTWSQDVDKAAASPLPYKNVAYSLHYYAATHKEWLRNKITTARNKGLCVMVTEYSITDSSGNGNVDLSSANAWATYMKENKMSYIQWSLCNKNESSALIKSSCNKLSGWDDNDLSETGKYLKQRLAS